MAWRAARGLSRDQRAAEQDQAAGGRERRTVILPDGGRAVASVYLRVPPKTRRIYAYLRWSERGSTVERYVGEVGEASRADNLSLAWSTIQKRQLLVAGSEPLANSRSSKRGESWASSPAVRAVMRGNKSRDTRPEKALRSAVHALGLRYRVGMRPLPEIRRTADLVFTRAKVAVFLDGCYWHGCPEHYRPSKQNKEFWEKKIGGNRARDAETDRLLREAGWETVRVWEHEDPLESAAKIARVVRDRSA
ncbi:very short patch repair endonuclease [Thermomonospora echinospora]